jgi:hypothetical protein
MPPRPGYVESRAWTNVAVVVPGRAANDGPVGMRFVRLTVLLALLGPASVAAAPGPIGYAFPANQMRVRHPFVDSTACEPVDGITTRVVADCPDTWCDELGDVYLEKRDGAATRRRARARPEQKG